MQQSFPIPWLAPTAQDRVAEHLDIADALHCATHMGCNVLVIWIGEQLDCVVSLLDLSDAKERS